MDVVLQEEDARDEGPPEEEERDLRPGLESEDVVDHQVVADQVCDYREERRGNRGPVEVILLLPPEVARQPAGGFRHVPELVLYQEEAEKYRPPVIEHELVHGVEREVRLVPVDHDGSGHRCDVFGRHPQELVRVQPEPVYHGQIGGDRQDFPDRSLWRGGPGDGASDGSLDPVFHEASNRGVVHRSVDARLRLLELVWAPGGVWPPRGLTFLRLTVYAISALQVRTGSHPLRRGRSGFQRGRSGSRSWRQIR